jgi:hypothetical protein
MTSTHVNTLYGSQQRGSAVGSLRIWEPSPNVWTTANSSGGVAARIEIPDALSLQIFIEVESGAPANAEAIDVKVSEDDVNYTSIYSGSIGTAGSVDIVPVTPGSGRQFVQEITGWKSRYLMIVVYAPIASNVKVYIVSSIFSSSPLVSVSPYATTNYYAPGGSATTGQTQVCTPQSGVPASTDGVAVTNANEIWVVVTGHATLAANVEIWMRVGGDWGIVDSFTLAAVVGAIKQYRGLGPERIAVRYTSNQPSAAKVKSVVTS